MPNHFHDLLGQRFGRRVVVAPAGRCPTRWRVRCDCGTENVVRATVLVDTVSCGCWRRDRMATLNLKHGHARAGKHSGEWNTWMGMLARCGNPGCRDWPRYGGRGVAVCARWLRFEDFLSDMGPRPPGMSLDRIDVDGNYEPGNCRWATAKTQGRNKRATHRATIDGVTLPLADWADRFGIPYQTVLRRARYGVRGRALLRPANRNHKFQPTDKDPGAPPWRSLVGAP